MPHRIKRFAYVAILARFYPFAAMDSISGFGGHHVDTKQDAKNDPATTELSLTDVMENWCPFTLSSMQKRHTFGSGESDIHSKCITCFEIDLRT
jgi:hypothetical protein